MALTPAQIDAAISALQLALATGERRVKYHDKEVEYRSIDELKNALNYFLSLKRKTPIYKTVGDYYNNLDC